MMLVLRGSGASVRWTSLGCSRRSSLQRPVGLARAVGHHHVQPRAELRPAREAADVGCDLEQDILAGLFGVLLAGSADEMPSASGLVGTLRRELRDRVLILGLSLIHISEPTRLGMISYA